MALAPAHRRIGQRRGVGLMISMSCSQPEIGAEAIVWVADHNRPELYVGAVTVAAIVGDKIAPRLGDWYLARTGYALQQSDRSVDPQRADNLWQPVAGDHGGHGMFDVLAHERSLQFWLTTRRRGPAAVASGLGAFLAAAIRYWRRH